MRFVAALLFPLLIVSLVSAQAPLVKELQQPKSDWDAGYFKNATIGDFASYNNLKGTLLRRPEVVAIGDRQVTVDVTGLAGDKPTIQSRQILVFSGPEWPASGQGKPTVSVVKVKVGERELTCELSEYRSPEGKLTRRTFKSPQVPFGGLVKDEGYKVDPDGKELVTGGQTLTDFRFANAPK